MSSRRVPLSSNPNVANSPIRSQSSALASVLGKHRQQKRAYASVQREEHYGQPPPTKKKLLNDGTEQPLRSPVRQVKVIRRDLSRAYKDEKISQASISKVAQQEDEAARVQRWKEATRHSFPSYVFYFESCPAEQRSKLVKQLTQLGAREEKFFSKDITHVITTRSIPTDKPTRIHADDASTSIQSQRGQYDMPKTIDPSLLSRDTSVKDIRRRLLESTRKVPVAPILEENAPRQPAASRHTDILIRAQEMKKKIWHFSKLQRVFEVMFDPNPLGLSASIPKAAEETNLAQLLNKERTNGPSDRDPTVATKELIYFKGPYIYIYDIEEKQKPIMVREYPKVADKKDGEWPQFRASSGGRCPFVEDEDPAERKRHVEKQAREKERKEKVVAEAAPEHKPPPPPPLAAPMARPVIGKRTLSEMEDGHNSRAGSVRPPEMFDLAKATNPPALDFRPQNAFTSRAQSARLFAGEPVASGIQPSNITSAIRSQMISSATGVLGAKAGTSKELHGLQRKVLQKSNATSANLSAIPTSQDLSSRRLAEVSLDAGHYQRSASLGHGPRKLGQAGDDQSKEHKRTMSVPAAVPTAKTKKRDLKPGYCENCQDKFNDFEEHILSKKHRKFAENDRNWSRLDSLLGQLERTPKYADDEDGENSD
ncbi:hypothetical protein M406DRAFT_334044 [Cryphonectria parasitica EP155]|uniref:DBF4-type domain-containing protein n=1 Tax=Cryphonectria parasitica (strain ATCC 38755 / EP155) TaxID=660469 RepID=A0A9P4XVF0_CRYP1|nr:uncharacterized protein M406DRAFT_334044 [Cryphonectria parasitica EP155]KAF3762007.1 hypothetical protein M406DRAFT_334044 [Cryphonectria parasitica EP155]